MKAQPLPPSPNTITYKLLTLEDEVLLEQRFPERERGGIITLVRAILAHHRNDNDKVETIIHKSFLPTSYWMNPSAFCQRIGNNFHNYIKGWRNGDQIHIRASNEDFASGRSWTGRIAERLEKLPQVNSTGGVPFIDIPWNEVPITYNKIVSRIRPFVDKHLQRCNHCEVKAYQTYLRIWLHRKPSPSPSKSPSPKRSKAAKNSIVTRS
jgi:hypothetical protein